MGRPVTATKQAVRLRWYRVIGPWPLRPIVVFIFACYFYLAIATGQLLGQANVQPGVWLRSVVLLAVPAAAVMAAVIYLGMLWQRRHGIRPVSYFVFIGLAAAAALAVRFATEAIPSDSLVAPVPIGVGMMRSTVFLLFTLAIAGNLTARLQRQVDATQLALADVEVQQRLMVEADEAARRQVAALLHDRVQAGLIAAGLELQMLMRTSPDADRDSVRVIIDRLESLRTLDVRRAARALSPDLHDVDLQTALEDLAAQYEPAMGTTVTVAPDLDSRRAALGDDIVLAVYRIVEQALLNSATHGSAQHTRVSVALDDERVLVTVQDDGQGLRTPGSPGLGSAVLTTWTRLFDGTWSLRGGDHGGAVLEVSLTPQV